MEALKKLCESIGFRTGAQVEFKLVADPAISLLAPGAAEAILRVAQEALANVARHARASRTSVSLESAKDHVLLIVDNNGSGFDPSQVLQGMEVLNMRTRAAEFGGELELRSSPEAGTTVKLFIPCLTARPSDPGIQAFLMTTNILNMLMWGPRHPWAMTTLTILMVALAAVSYSKTYGQRRLSGTALWTPP